MWARINVGGAERSLRGLGGADHLQPVRNHERGFSVRAKATANDSEFGLGAGVIDPTSRTDRQIEGYQELLEIYATDPAFPDEGRGLLKPGEVRTGKENDPKTCTINRP
jgi:hypothetical protein